MKTMSMPPDFKETSAAVSALMDELTHEKTFNGVGTGFSAIDDFVGFQNGDLILLGIPPGNDAFVMNLLENVAVRNKKTTVCFSPRDSAKKTLKDLLFIMSGFSQYDSSCSPEARAGLLTPSAELIGKAPLLVDDTTCISAKNIQKRCEALRDKTKIDFILVRDLYSVWTEEDGVYAASLLALKLLAMETDCPVLVTVPAFGETPYCLNRALDLEEEALNIPDKILILSVDRDPDVAAAELYINKHPDHNACAIPLKWDRWRGFRD